MENNTYGFNFKEEIKDYKDLCRNKKNCKYKTYLAWKRYIHNKIKEFDIETLENFRRFCLYREKTENRGKELFWSLSLTLISLYLTQLEIPEGYFLAAVIGYTLAAVIVTVVVILNYFSYVFPKDFYHDIVEITQEYIKSLPDDEKMLLK